MPAERPAPQNKDCSLLPNSGSSNGRPEDKARFFNSKYFWPLNAITLGEHIVDDGEDLLSTGERKQQTNDNTR